MNKVFKVIWSKARNCYVVASELAKSHTKSPKSGVLSHTLVAGVLACVLSCGAVMPAYADTFPALYDTDNYSSGGSVSATDSSVSSNAFTNVSNSTNLTVNGDISSSNFSVVGSSQPSQEYIPAGTGTFVCKADNTNVKTVTVSGIGGYGGNTSDWSDTITFNERRFASIVDFIHYIDSTSTITSVAPGNTYTVRSTLLDGGSSSPSSPGWGAPSSYGNTFSNGVSYNGSPYLGGNGGVMSVIYDSSGRIYLGGTSGRAGIVGIQGADGKAIALEMGSSKGFLVELVNKGDYYETETHFIDRQSAESLGTYTRTYATVGEELSIVGDYSPTLTVSDSSSLAVTGSANLEDGKLSVSNNSSVSTTGTLQANEISLSNTSSISASSDITANSILTMHGSGSSVRSVNGNINVDNTLLLDGTNLTAGNELIADDVQASYSTASANSMELGSVELDSFGSLQANGDITVDNDLRMMGDNNSVSNSSGTLSARSIMGGGDNSISSGSVKTTSGDIDAEGTDVTATESVESAGVVKLKSLNAPRLLGAGSGMSTLGGGLTVAGQVKGVAAGTADTDAVNVAQLNSAIAGASTPYVGVNGTSGLPNENGSGASGSNSIAIGTSASASTDLAIALGASTTVLALDSTAIGYQAKVNNGATNSVALGGGSETTEANTVSVGNSTTRRRIVNVADGTNDHDVVTVGQVKRNISGLSVSGKTITYTKVDGTTGTITTQDTDTHYTSGLYVGSGTKANAATTNGNTKIALYDDNTARNTITIKGTGATSVTSDANGVITINSTDNNTTYSAFTGASASAAGSAGLVKAPSAGDQTKFLRGDGTWAVDNDTKYSAATASALGLVKIGSNITNSSGTISLTKANVTSALGYTPPTADTDTHYTSHLYVGSGTAANAATTNGNTKIALYDNSTAREALTIKGAGKTTVTSDANGVITITSTDANTTYDAMTASEATTGTGTTARSITAKVLADYVGGKVTDAKNGTITDLSISGKTITYTKGDGTTGTLTTQDTNTTYSAFTGATSSAAGTVGLVKAPAAGDQNKFLRGDGTWATDNNTTYSAGTGLSLSGTTFSVNTNGSVASGNAGVLNGGTVYSEVRPTADGTFAKKANTTAANITALDTAAKNAIKGLSVSGKTITYTKGDGTTGTITTQDTNTTYDNMSATELSTGTATTARSISAKTIADYVKGQVSAETTARTSAISSEATTRADADTALGSRIDESIKTLSVSGTTITYTKGDGTTGTITTQDNNTTYSNMSASELNTGTATNARTISAKTIADYVTGKVSAETTARNTAISSEATARADADTALGSRIDESIKGLSVSGKTITYTKGDGTTGTITTQDTNTTYAAGNGVALSGTTFSAKAGTNVTVNSSGINVVGNGSVASGNTGLVSGGTLFTENRITADGTFAKKANTTAANITALDTAAKNAIKALSVSGQTITYTKGDGTKGTITTQDNNTTYDNMSATELSTGTATTARSVSAKTIADYVTNVIQLSSISIKSGLGFSVLHCNQFS